MHTNSTGHYSSGCYRAQSFIPAAALWEGTGVCRWSTTKAAFPRNEGSKLLGSFKRHQNAALGIMSGWNPINTHFINESRHFSMHSHEMHEGLRGTSLIIFSRAKLLLNFFLLIYKWELCGDQRLSLNYGSLPQHLKDALACSLSERSVYFVMRCRSVLPDLNTCFMYGPLCISSTNWGNDMSLGTVVLITF